MPSKPIQHLTTAQLRAKYRDHDVFTTGEAAEICKVSVQTIIRNFDRGALKGSVLESDSELEILIVFDTYTAGIESERFDPDLVVIDSTKAGGFSNSLAICKNTLGLPEHPHIIVIGVESQPKQQRFLDLGVVKVYPKPINGMELLNEIREVLGIAA